MVIIETEIFTELVTELMDDEEYAELQKHMVENPKEGDVIQGTGGVRKLRWSHDKKGQTWRSSRHLLPRRCASPAQDVAGL